MDQPKSTSTSSSLAPSLGTIDWNGPSPLTQTRGFALRLTSLYDAVAGSDTDTSLLGGTSPSAFYEIVSGVLDQDDITEGTIKVLCEVFLRWVRPL